MGKSAVENAKSMFRLRSKGTATVELAITFPFFVLITLACFEVLRLSYNYVAIQIVANQGVHWAANQPCDLNPANNSPGLQFTCKVADALYKGNLIKNKIENFAKGMGVFGLGGANFAVCISPQNVPVNCIDPSWDAGLGVPKMGMPRELFLVRIRKKVPLAFGIRTVNVEGLGLGSYESEVINP